MILFQARNNKNKLNLSMGGFCSTADPNILIYGEFKTQLSLPRLVRL
jgi:hypothetical protein